jgi:predicted secreted protein
MKRVFWAIIMMTVSASFAMAAPTMRYLSTNNAESLITLDQRTVAVIELKSNPSTGHGWRVKSPYGRNIRIVGNEFEPSEPGRLGAGGIEKIYVVGAARGRSNLILEYRRARSSVAVKRFRYSFYTQKVFTQTFSLPSPAEPERAEDSRLQASSKLGLPTAFNWCDQNGCTPVKDQGNCGSCWAFATVGPLESLIKISDGETVDLSEQYLVSCNSEGWGCDGGFWAHDYHEWKTAGNQREAGAVLEQNAPYEARDSGCGSNYDKSHRIASWEYVCGNSSCTPSTDQLKQAIYDHGPVTVAVCANSAMQNYSGGVFTGPGCSQPNHGVVLVGWNDDESCWIMRNSWGRNWGESGYMRIGYGVSSIGTEAAYVEYDGPPNPDPEPAPAPEPAPEPEPEHTGQCITADNQEHIAQGRAYRCGYSFFPRACAVGSDDNLGWLYGSSSSQPPTSVQETAENYWEKVDSCP